MSNPMEPAGPDNNGPFVFSSAAPGADEDVTIPENGAPPQHANIAAANGANGVNGVGAGAVDGGGRTVGVYSRVEPSSNGGVPGAAVRDGDNPLLRHEGLAERDRDMQWFSPSVPSPAARTAEVEARLAGIARTLEGHPGWQQFLGWTYHTRARASAEELEATEGQIRQGTEERVRHAHMRQERLRHEIERLENDRPALEESLKAEADRFADAMGKAGLSSPPGDSAIGPQQVEEALQDAAPTLDEVAGERGLVPVSASAQHATLGKQLLEGVAPGRVRLHARAVRRHADGPAVAYRPEELRPPGAARAGRRARHR
jgi:hypothetical protein